MNTSTFQLNSQNPFPCDLVAAQNEFFQTLSAVQRQKLSRKAIEKAYDETVEDLNEQWEDLQSLAQDELVQRVMLQLNIFMKGYARQKAFYQFLDSIASGWTLTPLTPGLQKSLADKLSQKHTQLSSTLLQVLTTAICKREKAEGREAETIAETRLGFVEQSMEREYGRNKDLYQQVMTALGQIQEQAGKTPREVRDAHNDARASLEDARKSLELAMSGARQVQDVFPHIMNPAIEIVKSANDLVKSNNQYIQQNLPYAVEEAQVRANGRKTRARLMWFGVALVVMVTLPLLAFLLIQFL